MEPLKNLKQLQGFVGVVNYNRDMWPHICHVLVPLTSVACAKLKHGKKLTKSVWIDKMQKAFDQMKSLIAINAILAYPDHNKRFEMYTDLSARGLY